MPNHGTPPVGGGSDGGDGEPKDNTPLPITPDDQG